MVLAVPWLLQCNFNIITMHAKGGPEGHRVGASQANRWRDKQRKPEGCARPRLQEDVEDDDLQNAIDHDHDDDEEREEEAPNNSLFQYENRYNILFRLLICTLTAILALIEWNFDLILAISGAFGLLGVYGGPTILGWKSKVK